MVTYKTEPNADLEFTFPDNLVWEELDKQGHSLPHNMKLVDFIIEREKDILLVEVKDPSHARAKASDREKFLEKIRTKTLIAHDLVPKARCSYLALHLWERDAKPFIYVVLLALDACQLENEKSVLVAFKDTLAARLAHEAWEPWVREYIKDCIVLTLDTWNDKYFPQWPVTRTSVADCAN